MSQRDKRALLILGAAAAVFLPLQFGLFPGAGFGSPAFPSLGKSERQLRRLQEAARRKPAAAAESDAAARALAEAERGLLKASTPAQASAEMQQILKDVLMAQGITMQSSEFGAVKLEGKDYAQVPLTVAFICGIDQWINFMAALRSAPQVLSSHEMRITAGDAKTKQLQVRMVVAGYISAGLAARPAEPRS